MEHTTTKKTPFVLLALIAAAFATLGFTYPGGVGSTRGDYGFALPFEALARAQTTSQTPSPTSSMANLDPTAAYKDTMDRLLTEYYWKDNVDTDDLTYAAIRGMMASLGDPYTRFLDPEEWKEMSSENKGDFGGIGATVGTAEDGRSIIDWVIPDNPAAKAKVKSGDIIVAVDGVNVEKEIVSDVVKKIKGTPGTQVKLTVERLVTPKGKKTQRVNITVTRAVVDYPVIRVRKPEEWKQLGISDPEKEGIGYVQLLQFNQKTDEKFIEAMTQIKGRLGKNFKGLILDLRNNPGGLLDSAVAVSQRFVDEGTIVSVQDRASVKEQVRYASAARTLKNKLGLDLKVVALVNGNSASGAEILAGALKDHGAAKLVGERTFGKGLVQTLYNLQPVDSRSGDSAAAITTAVYYTPSHYSISDEGGIKPDYEVKLPKLDPKKPIKREDLKDIQYDKALAIMHEELGIKPTKPAKRK